MKLVEVIERAITDKDFGQELKAKAEAAYKAGVDTDEWTDLMKEFAESPEELARLRKPGSHGGHSGDSETSVTSRTDTFTTTTTTTTMAAPKFLVDFSKRNPPPEYKQE